MKHNKIIFDCDIGCDDAGGALMTVWLADRADLIPWLLPVLLSALLLFIRERIPSQIGRASCRERV